MPSALEVGDLPAHHAPAARGVGDVREHVGEPLSVAPRAALFGDEPEGQRQERVPGQDGDGFAEHLVVGGNAAAEVVVVHRGQVVVDQRVGVDHLHRAGGGHHLRPRLPPTASAPAMTSTGRSRLPPANTL